MTKEFKALQQAIEDLTGAADANALHTTNLKKAFDSYCEKTANTTRRKRAPKKVFINIIHGVPTVYATKGTEVFIHDEDIYKNGDAADLCDRQHPFIPTIEGKGKPDYYVSSDRISVLKQEAMDMLRKEQEACA